MSQSLSTPQAKTKPAQSGPLLTGRGFVDHIRQHYLADFKYSRFRKDRAARKAPEPWAYFGPAELFHPSQAEPYIESLNVKSAARRSARSVTKATHAA